MGTQTSSRFALETRIGTRRDRVKITAPRHEMGIIRNRVCTPPGHTAGRGGDDDRARREQTTRSCGHGRMIDAVVHALSVAFGMTWEILWPLILGFTLSGIVQAVVSKREMTKLLPDESIRSLAVACGLGAASSSCSYAAVALARSLF